MIVDERMVTFINSLDEGHTEFLEQLEKEAREDAVPIVRREMQSFLKFLMAAARPKRILEVGTAAYATRYIAKNMVAAGVADEMLVQVSYAIGVAEPVSIYVNTYGRSHVNMTDSEIAKKIAEMFDLRPKAIERQLKLRQPMFFETAAYGHMGRKNEVVEKTFTSRYHEAKTMKVELFTWEKLDKVDEIKKAFGL